MLETLDAHAGGLGGAVFVGKDSIISCGGDGKLCVREADDPSTLRRQVSRVDACPIHCIAASPKRSQYAVGDKSKQVMVYDHRTGEGVLGARLVMPVLVLSYNGLGSKLAAGGEDEIIYIINLSTNHETNTLKTTVIQKLRAGPHTRGLAYDPEGEYLASLSATGHLQIWRLEDGKQKLSQKHTAPNVTGKGETRSMLAWHPDGTDLAVPGLEGEVVFYERHNWKVSCTLQGNHTAPVSMLAFSPNGLYLATAGQDCKLVVWELRSKAQVAMETSPAALVSMDWRPEGNCLLCMTVEGKLLLWKNAVPSGHRGPCEAGDALRPMSASLSDGRTDSHTEVSAGQTGAAGASSGHGGRQLDAFDEIIQGDEEEDADIASSPAREVRRPSALAGPGPLVSRTPLQAAFQPGATRAGSTGRRWLAYDLRGGISLREEEGMNIIDVAFHNTGADHRRVAPYRDYHSLDMAALGDKGAFYARAGSKREAALLEWRPLQSLFPKSDWTLELPAGERALAIAAGRGFVAVATSLHQLSIFTLSGLRMFTGTLAGPPVALAAKGNLLALVWHGSPSALPGNQSLMFAIYDVNHRLLLHEGPLPISNGGTLTWLGFSDEGLLSTFDTQGVLRVRTVDFGGSWVPLFAAAAHQKGKETYWPVAVTKAELFCIVCASAAVPSVLPRPVLTKLGLAPPLLSADDPMAALEGEWLRLAAHLAFQRARVAEETDPEEAEQLEEEMLCDQTDADRALLKLFQDALKAGRFQRAHELAASMHLPRSLEGALKLTNFHRVPALAERIHQLLANKAEEAAQAYKPETAVTPLPAPTFTPDAAEPPSLEESSPPSRLADVAITEASGNASEADGNAGSETKPRSRATGAGSSMVPGGNPFARSVPLKPKNTLLSSIPVNESGSGKRKGLSSNPFMRRPKVAR